MSDTGDQTLSLEMRMKLFAALVEAQDKELGTARSRQLVATQFGVTDKDVRKIEEEGLREEWPPLS